MTSTTRTVQQIHICAAWNVWSLAEASQLSFDHKFSPPPLCDSFISAYAQFLCQFLKLRTELLKEGSKRQDARIVWNFKFLSQDNNENE